MRLYIYLLSTIISIASLSAQTFDNDQYKSNRDMSALRTEVYGDTDEADYFYLMQKEDLNEARVYAINSEIFISLKTTSDIGIYDITGRCVATFKNQNGDLKVSVKSGMYIVKVSSGDKSKAFKVLVR